jgi:replicative DNA helicase
VTAVAGAAPPAEVLDRTPPQDLEAERSVLGAMMISAQAIADVQDELEPGDFYRPQHETIYAAIASLDGRRQRVDAITVADELRRTGDLGRIGGAPVLHELVAADRKSVV